jgi:hypothetical protein
MNPDVAQCANLTKCDIEIRGNRTVLRRSEPSIAETLLIALSAATPQTNLLDFV